MGSAMGSVLLHRPQIRARTMRGCATSAAATSRPLWHTSSNCLAGAALQGVSVPRLAGPLGRSTESLRALARLGAV